MRALALILALFLPCVAAAQSLSEPVEGGYSPVAARYQWGSTGGDFPLPAGSTVLADCSGAALQAGAACSVGAAWTVGGVPTLVPSYWRAGGGVAGSAVLLGGGASVTSPSLTYGTVCKRGRTAAGVAEVNCTAGATTGAIVLDSGAVERVVVIAEVLDAAAITRVQKASFAAVGSLGEPLTVSSPATSAVLVKADGSPYVATTPANTPSIVAGGVQVYPAYIQSTLYPSDLSQAVWTKEAGVTYEAASASCPIGPDNTRMTLVTTAADKGVYQSWTHAATAYTASAWLARASADSDCTVSLGFAGQAGLGYAQPTLTAVPARVSLTKTSAAVASGVHILTRTGDTCTRFCMWGANETNTTALMPYAYAAASPLSVAATSISAGHGIADPNRWCIAATVTPASSSVANHGYLWTTRTAAAANTASLRLGNGTTSCEFNVYDSTGSQRAVAFACDADRHRYTACDANGALSISIDGSVVGTSSTGGTGMLSALGSTLFIGAFASGSSAYLGGTISAITTCNTASPEECQ